MSVPELLLLGLKIALAALFSFGGLTSVLVEIEHDLVPATGMTVDQFTGTYALAAAAPGPNGPIFVALLGWQVAGALGLVVFLVGWAVPTLLVMQGLELLGDRANRPAVARLLRVMEAGAVGLIAGGVLAMIGSFDFAVPWQGVVQCVLAAGSVLAIQRKWLTPLQALLFCLGAGVLIL